MTLLRVAGPRTAQPDYELQRRIFEGLSAAQRERGYRYIVLARSPYWRVRRVGETAA